METITHHFAQKEVVVVYCVVVSPRPPHFNIAVERPNLGGVAVETITHHPKALTGESVHTVGNTKMTG